MQDTTYSPVGLASCCVASIRTALAVSRDSLVEHDDERECGVCGSALVLNDRTWISERFACGL